MQKPRNNMNTNHLLVVMRRRLLLFSCIFNLAVASAQSLDSDSLLVTLGTELRYNMSQLQQQPNNIPYFMSLRLVDEQSTSSAVISVLLPSIPPTAV